MAQIKISGYSEMVQVSESEAKDIQVLLNDKNVLKSDMISVGSLSVLKSEIKGVFFQPVMNIYGEQHKEEVRKFYEKRDKEVALFPEQKAQRSLAQFRLFYYGAKGIALKQEDNKQLVEQYLKAATKWFEDNPLWVHCSLKVMFEIMGKDTKLEASVLRLLERAETSELQDVSQSIEFNQSRQDSIPVFEKELTAEDLPF